MCGRRINYVCLPLHSVSASISMPNFKAAWGFGLGQKEPGGHGTDGQTGSSWLTALEHSA